MASSSVQLYGSQNGSSPNGIINAPDLDRAVRGLAKAVQDSMASLHDLQTAVAIAVANSKRYQTLLDSLKISRCNLRETWEELIPFLERCNSYTDDYISLCKYATTHPISDAVVPAADLLNIAKTLIGEGRALETKHDKEFAEIRRFNLKARALLTGRSSTSTSIWMSRGSRGPTRSRTLDGDLRDFIGAAEASLRPDGQKAAQSSEVALEATQNALTDLNKFWEDQRDHVSMLLSGRESISSALPIQSLVGRWVGYQPSIQAAISSISASSDAAAVPTGETSKNIGCGRNGVVEEGQLVSGGLWRRMWSRLRTRGN